MRLKRARVQNYRSIHDTGWFEVEPGKTILVGPNEAGKTAVLRALQTVKPAPGAETDLHSLRDFPRARWANYSEAQIAKMAVASAEYELDDDDRAVLAEHADYLARANSFGVTRLHGGGLTYRFDGEIALSAPYKTVEKPLGRLRGLVAGDGDEAAALVTALEELVSDWVPDTQLQGERGEALDKWLGEAMAHLDFDDPKVDAMFDDVRAGARRHTRSLAAFNAVWKRVPFFVYFSQYYKIRPRIHLGRLASQIADDDVDLEFDFGNVCLLKFLRFDAAELSELGRGVPESVTDEYGNAVKASDDDIARYKDRLDDRDYRLNAAATSLTQQVSEVWGEDRTLDIRADGDYLKVVLLHEDGGRVELDQGSEGFRWLVSFYVVFRAQARDELANAILLLDEPGVSLHALKQKQFRKTVSKIAEGNQTLFTTHSPFMVGTDELDLVRIVEMKDRGTGTKVHEDFAVGDPRSLFPLQAHFGYELGQTAFGQRRNLVVEGITDYWYLQGATEAAADASAPALDDKVTISPAGDAGKVVYHATALHAQGLKVASLFDSDPSGQRAAAQETFSSLFKPRQVLRVADFYDGQVKAPETEDLLRDTLVQVATEELGINAVTLAGQQPARPVVDVLAEVGGDQFSKYRLAKAFLRWLRSHGWADLQPHEQKALGGLFEAANKGTR